MTTQILNLFLFLLLPIQMVGQSLVHSAIENKKEIKTYKNGILETVEQFDREGNLIFGQIFDREGEAVSLLYHRYTADGEMDKMISASKIWGLDVWRFDDSRKGIKKTYINSWKGKKFYDKAYKKLLKKVNSIEDLLEHKQVKKLMKEEKNLMGAVYEDGMGNDVLRLNLNLSKDTVMMARHVYNAASKITCSWMLVNSLSDGSKTLYLSEYDDSGNVVKITQGESDNLKGINSTWHVTKTRYFVFNAQNVKIKQYSVVNSEKVTESQWFYNEAGQIQKVLTYDEHGVLSREHRYIYEQGILKSRIVQDVKSIKVDSEYRPDIYTFEVDLYTSR